jgi:hypothetical protein
VSGSHRTLSLAAAITGATIGLVPLGVSAALAAPALAAPAPSSGCADIEVLVNRGTSEPGTIGSLSVLSNAITTGTGKTVATWGNPYSASFSFATSTPEGVTDLTNELTSQSAACPAQKFVLLGYSQGAIVAGDTLGGGSFTASAPLNSAIAAKVVAVVMWGDPRFNSAEPFDAGTFKAGVNGTFARTTGALKTFNARIQDFCLAEDGVCQGNGTLNINAGHLSYPRNSTAIQAGTTFALAKIDGSAGAGTSATPTAAPTTAPGTAAPVRHHRSLWKRLFG